VQIRNHEADYNEKYSKVCELRIISQKPIRHFLSRRPRHNLDFWSFQDSEYPDNCFTLSLQVPVT